MKKSLLRVIVSLILCFSIFCSTLPAFASDTSSTYVYEGKTYSINVMEYNGIKTVKVQSEGETNIIRLNVKNKNVNIQTLSENGTIKLNKNTTLAPVVKNGSQQTNSATFKSLENYTRIASGNEIWWGYYYNIYKYSTGGYWWGLTCGGEIKVPDETSSNTGDLNGFKDAVDSAWSNQVIANSMLGAATAAAIAGAISAAETVGIGLIIGLIVAAGGAVGAAGYFLAGWNNCRDADYHFARV